MLTDGMQYMNAEVVLKFILFIAAAIVIYEIGHWVTHR